MPKVSRDEAFKQYCAMGAERSLTKLHEHFLKELGKGAPSLGALKLWCRQEYWTSRAAEYERQVAEATHGKMVGAVSQHRADIAVKLDRTTDRSLDRLDKEIAEIEIKDVRDLLVLADAVVNLQTLKLEIGRGQAPIQDLMEAMAGHLADTRKRSEVDQCEGDDILAIYHQRTRIGRPPN